MKQTRKIASLILALVMIFSLATTAFAAEDDTPQKNDSITITEAVEKETYKLYKMFDLSVNDENNPTAFTYTVNAAWKEFFAEGGAGHQYVIFDDELGIYVTGLVGDDDVARAQTAAALAKAAAAWTGKLDALETIEATSDTVTFDGLENGYYLITSTLGTVAMIETTPANEDVTIEEKNPEDTIIKEVKEDSTGVYGEENDAQVGDTVEFKSTITLYPNTRNVKVHDKMDDGLTYTSGSVKIEGLTVGTDYTFDENPTDGDTFEIIFTDSYINSLTQTTTLTLTYTATLNGNAVVKGDNGVAIVDQHNKTNITYGDKQSVEDETVTTTHKFNVFKHATGSEDNLADAVFSLKRNGVVVPLVKIDDNNYRVAVKGDSEITDTFTTVATGDIVIWGVDADDPDNDKYTLEEITPPAGYNKLSDKVTVTVNEDNGTRVDVENKSGTELPSTGGIGTTIFYVVGGLLAAAAVVLLITKKRMSTNG